MAHLEQHLLNKHKAMSLKQVPQNRKSKSFFGGDFKVLYG
jgi:hypothetical protein